MPYKDIVSSPKSLQSKYSILGQLKNQLLNRRLWPTSAMGTLIGVVWINQNAYTAYIDIQR